MKCSYVTFDLRQSVTDVSDLDVGVNNEKQQHYNISSVNTVSERPSGAVYSCFSLSQAWNFYTTSIAC